MKKLKMTFFIIILIFLSSCQNQSILICDNSPDVIVSIKDVNKSIRLHIPTELNTFKIGDNLRITLENLSGKMILLQDDYGIKFFIKINNNWYPIQNNYYYPSGEKQIPAADQANRSGALIVAHPELINNKEVSQIKVIIIGNTVNGTGEFNNKIGAYVDITLVP